MSSEHFKILKEINSLSSSEASLIQKIAQEEKRLDQIVELRKQKELKLKSLEDEKKNISLEGQRIEKDLSKLHSDLDRDKTNLSSIVTEESLKNLENQIADKERKIEILEELAYSQLEKSDEIDNNISDHNSFLEGSLETLSEIQVEVDKETSKLNEEITKIQNRINLLLEEIPPQFKSLYERVKLKDIKTSVFTRIKNGSCEFCRFQVSANDKINIEDNLQLKTCSSCSRIFIPEQAFY